MAPRANRTAPRLLFLAGGLLLAGLLLTGCGSVSISGEQRDFTLEGGTLVVEADETELELVADDSLTDEVQVTRWFDAKPLLGDAATDWEMRDGHVLALTTNCRGIATNCSSRHEVRVPSTLDVTVETRNGPVRAGGLTGALTVATHNGAIELDGHDGAAELTTRNGQVRADGALTGATTVETHNGDIRLALTAEPESVRTESRNGGTTIEVPGDVTYRVATDATNGDVSVTVPHVVAEDAAGSEAAPRIEADSHNGPITVRAAEAAD